MAAPEPAPIAVQAMLPNALEFLERVGQHLTGRPGHQEWFETMNDFLGDRLDGMIERAARILADAPELFLGLQPFVPEGYRISWSAEDAPDGSRGVMRMTAPSGETRDVGLVQAAPSTSAAPAVAPEASVEAQDAPPREPSPPVAPAPVEPTPAPSQPPDEPAEPSFAVEASLKQPVDATAMPSSPQELVTAGGEIVPASSAPAVEEAVDAAVDGAGVNGVAAESDIAIASMPSDIAPAAAAPSPVVAELMEHVDAVEPPAEIPDMAEDEAESLDQIRRDQIQQKLSPPLADEVTPPEDAEPVVDGGRKRKASQRKLEADTVEAQIELETAPLSDAGPVAPAPAPVALTAASSRGKRARPSRPESAVPSRQASPAVDADKPKVKRPRVSKPAVNAAATSDNAADPNAIVDSAPASHEPIPPPTAPSRELGETERRFFERVYRHLGDKHIYIEFLKTCNLFTQGIIQLDALVARAHLFLIKDPELWREFAIMVGEDPDAEAKPTIAEDGAGTAAMDEDRPPVEPMTSSERRMSQPSPSRRTLMREIPLGRNVEHGPSYRRLTWSEATSAPCSGRDALCQSVLNDEFVSAPTWTSEEGFVPARKNMYEDALIRCEEERYDYDIRLSANVRCLAMLDELDLHIQALPEADRAAYKIRPGQDGAPSAATIACLIKRVYGAEAGVDVLAALYDEPAYTVEAVLTRVRDKATAWRDGLSQWNDIWADIEARNFYKALDHKALAVKLVDKKLVTAKSLVADMELVRREQQADRDRYALVDVTQQPRSQLVLEFADMGCVVDTVRMIVGYLDRILGPYTDADKDRIEAFVRQIVPLMLGVPSSVISEHVARMPAPPAPVASARGTPGPDGTESDAEIPTTASGLTSSAVFEAAVVSDNPPAQAIAEAFGKRSHKKGAAELRRKALRNTAAAPISRVNRRMANAAASAPSSPAPSSVEVTGALTATDRIASSIAANLVPSRAPSPSVDPSPWSPTLAASTAATIIAGSAQSPAVAPVSLPSMHLQYPSTDALDPDRLNLFCHSTLYCILRLFHVMYDRLLSVKTAALQGIPGIGPEAYPAALTQCDRLFSNELEPQAFEDNARGLLGMHAWPLFTIDKLLASFARLVGSSVETSTALNERHDRVMQLLLHDRACPPALRRRTSSQISYRLAVEAALGHDQSLFRLTWIPRTHSLEVQLYGRDELAREDEIEARLSWETYLLSFVTLDRTVGLQNLDIRTPALSRHTLAATSDEAERAEVIKTIRGGAKLELKVCMRSYKLFYGHDTEDWHVRPASAAPPAPSWKKARFERWLDAAVARGEPPAVTVSAPASVADEGMDVDL